MDGTRSHKSGPPFLQGLVNKDSPKHTLQRRTPETHNRVHKAESQTHPPKTYVYTQTCAHAHTLTYIHIRVRTYRTHMQSCTLTCTYVDTHNVHACSCVQTHTRGRAHSERTGTDPPSFLFPLTRTEDDDPLSSGVPFRNLSWCKQLSQRDPTPVRNEST